MPTPAMIRRKRKVSDEEFEKELGLSSPFDSILLTSRSHFSLEDYNPITKRCREEATDDKPSTSGKQNTIAIATAPPCGAALSAVLQGRGLKRKIGCIDNATSVGKRTNIWDHYISGDILGSGKFGSVRLCKSKSTGVEFACKTLVKGQYTVHKEVEIMQHLSGHPGVVTLQSVYEEADCFHLVMELCTGGRLVDHMIKGKYCEQGAAAIFREVMMVIQYCHDMGVVHRDIKPENILFTSSGRVKLADFGLALRISKGQQLCGLAGSPAYVAPEVLMGNFSEKADVWSAGVLLYSLLIGVLPFQGDSLDSLFDAIKNEKLDLNKGRWEGVSRAARDLVSRMLTRDVSARISAADVVMHPWLLFSERPAKALPVKEECSLMDELTVAIAQVTISEAKRSRVCLVDGSVDKTPSNLTSNLCRAF